MEKKIEEMNAFEAVDTAIKAVKHLINNFPLSLSERLDANRALTELRFAQDSMEADRRIAEADALKQ